MKILAGNSNRPLSAAIAKELGTSLIAADITYFNNHEISVTINENVRDKDIFIIQSISKPVNDYIIELTLMADALKCASARHVTAVIPYYGYARQDRQSHFGAPVAARLIARILTNAGINSVITVDLHSPQIEGFFDIPLDNVATTNVFAYDIREKYDHASLVVSPDIGGVRRARDLARAINTDFVLIDKQRERSGITEVKSIIGYVNKKDCILVDDIVDSAKTLCNAANALVKNGARSVVGYVTHGVLSSGAIELINESALEELIITDSVLIAEEIRQHAKMRVVSVASLLAKAIKSIAN